MVEKEIVHVNICVHPPTQSVIISHHLTTKRKHTKEATQRKAEPTNKNDLKVPVM